MTETFFNQYRKVQNFDGGKNLTKFDKWSIHKTLIDK